MSNDWRTEIPSRRGRWLVAVVASAALFGCGGRLGPELRELVDAQTPPVTDLGYGGQYLFVGVQHVTDRSGQRDLTRVVYRVERQPRDSTLVFRFPFEGWFQFRWGGGFVRRISGAVEKMEEASLRRIDGEMGTDSHWEVRVTGVTVGCVLEFNYETFRSERGGVSRLIPILRDAPIRHFSLRATHPRAASFRCAHFNCSPTPEVKEISGEIRVSLDLHDLPGLGNELFAPAADDLRVCPVVLFSTQPSWDALATTVVRWQLEKVPTAPEFVARVTEAVGGATDETEIVERLFGFVAHRIRWIADRDASGGGARYLRPESVLRDGRATPWERAETLYVMLRSAGIPAVAGYARPGRGDSVSVEVPMFRSISKRFVVAVPMKGAGYRILDPARRRARSDYLPGDIQGGLVWLVEPSGAQRFIRVAHEPPEKSVWDETHTVELADDGSVTVEATANLTGEYALEAARQVEASGRDGLAPSLRRFGAEPRNVIQVGSETPGRDLSVSWELRIPSYGRREGARRVLSPVVEQIEYAQIDPERGRHWPLQPWTPSVRRVRGIVKLPPGYRPAGLPKAISGEDARFGRFDTAYSLDALGFRYDLRQVSASTWVPREQVKEFVRHWKSAANAFTSEFAIEQSSGRPGIEDGTGSAPPAAGSKSGR